MIYVKSQSTHSLFFFWFFLTTVFRLLSDTVRSYLFIRVIEFAIGLLLMNVKAYGVHDPKTALPNKHCGTGLFPSHL